MKGSDHTSNRAKKGCTDSLSEEEIEKEISAIIEKHCNVYALKNVQLNLVTDGLEKPAYVVEERPEGILIRRLEI